MTNIQLVVFDMAGTTVTDQNEVESCFVQAADNTGLPYSRDDIMSMMGWSKKRVFEILWAKARPDLSVSGLTILIDRSYREFKMILENHYRLAAVTPTAHCLMMFNELRSRDIKIALTTGFYREVTNIILARLGWNQGLDKHYLGGKNSLIQLSVASDEVAQGRPAPDMILKCMETLHVHDPKNVINIGDTPSDLEAGKRAGCLYSLGICNGTHTREQLAALPNDGLLQNLAQLADYL
jgi:phosphonatase-like hydrolase